MNPGLPSSESQEGPLNRGLARALGREPAAIRALLEVVGAGAAIFDRSGNLTEANSRFRAVWDTEVLGESWEGVTPLVREACRGVLETGTARALWARLSAADSSLDRIQIFPVPGEGGVPEAVLVLSTPSPSHTDMDLEIEVSRGREITSLLESFLNAGDFDEFLSQAVLTVTRVLDVPFCEVLWPGESEEELRIRAFLGWEADTVSDVIVRPGNGSQTGFALVTRRPVVDTGLEPEGHFLRPVIHRHHGVRSGVTVPLLQGHTAVGVLGVHDREPRPYDEGDIRFLETVARIIMAAWHRAQAVEELGRSEEHLAAVFDQTDEGLYLLTIPDGAPVRYELVNPSLKRLTGLTFEAPGGIRGEASERFSLEDLRAALEVPVNGEEERPFDLPTGVRRLAVSRTAVPDPTGEGTRVVGVVRDVTAEYELETHLALTRRMESLSRLSGGMAHELNNILTGFLGSLALLEARVQEPEAQNELRSLKRDARRASSIMGRIVQFSRREPPEPAPISVTSVMKSAATRFRSAGDFPRVVVGIQEGPEPSEAYGNAHELREIILELLTNAAEAMEGEGRVQLRAYEEVVGEPGQSEVAGLRPGTYVVVEVEDEGPGIPPEILNRIFDPFFTTHRDQDRLGLGLPAAFGSIRQFGGTLLVQSHLGDGTLVRILLPTPDGDPEAPSAPAGQGREEQPGARILLVEDEDTVRRVTALLLERLGYTVTAAQDAEDALSRFERDPEAFDMILTDVVMPGRTGIEMVEEILGRFGPQRVLFTSGFPSKELGRTPEAPPQPFLPKPFSYEDLRRAVGRVLAAAPLGA